MLNRGKQGRKNMRLKNLACFLYDQHFGRKALEKDEIKRLLHCERTFRTDGSLAAP